MLIKMLLIAVVALVAALAVACRVLCKERKERIAACRKLSAEYAKSAHLVGVIRLIQRGQGE